MGLELEIKRQDFNVYCAKINGEEVVANEHESSVTIDDDGDFTVNLVMDTDDLVEAAGVDEVIEELERRGYKVMEEE